MGLLKNFFNHHLALPADKVDPAITDASAGPTAHTPSTQRDMQILDWVQQGLPVPPPHTVKQAIVRTYARRHHTDTLVETGTYFGDMVAAMRNDFTHIYSIELSQDLHTRAAARFSGEPGITLIQGDSGEAITQVLGKLSAPALFWLDGHWSSGVTARGSGDTPVREELAAIFAATEMPHVILIDDARLFGADPAYPSVEELRKLVSVRRPQMELTVDTDIIRIVPRSDRNAPA